MQVPRPRLRSPPTTSIRGLVCRTIRNGASRIFLSDWSETVRIRDVRNPSSGTVRTRMVVRSVGRSDARRGKRGDAMQDATFEDFWRRQNGSEILEGNVILQECSFGEGFGRKKAAKKKLLEQGLASSPFRFNSPMHCSCSVSQPTRHSGPMVSGSV